VYGMYMYVCGECVCVICMNMYVVSVCVFVSVFGNPDGTVIRNDAGIYFDFNAPVITNTVINTIDKAVGMKEPALPNVMTVHVYPNPFHETAVIDLNGITIEPGLSLVFYDLLGKEVNRINEIGSKKITISKEDLGSGMYIYQVLSGSSSLGKGKIVIR